jgi:hypothetical protein
VDAADEVSDSAGDEDSSASSSSSSAGKGKPIAAVKAPEVLSSDPVPAGHHFFAPAAASKKGK